MSLLFHRKLNINLSALWTGSNNMTLICGKYTLNHENGQQSKLVKFYNTLNYVITLGAKWYRSTSGGPNQSTYNQLNRATWGLQISNILKTFLKVLNIFSGEKHFYLCVDQWMLFVILGKKGNNQEVCMIYIQKCVWLTMQCICFQFGSFFLLEKEVVIYFTFGFNSVAYQKGKLLNWRMCI